MLRNTQLLLICCVSVSCIIQTAVAVSDPNKALSMNAKYILSGSVFEENGSKLEDYLLLVSTSEMNQTNRRLERNMRRLEVNHRFNVVIDAAMRVQLVFYKKGYLPKAIQYDYLDVALTRRKRLDAQIVAGSLNMKTVRENPRNYYENLELRDPNIVVTLLKAPEEPIDVRPEFLRFALTAANQSEDIILPVTCSVTKTGVSAHLELNQDTGEIEKCSLRAENEAGLLLVRNMGYHEIIMAPADTEYLREVDLVALREYPSIVIIRTIGGYYLKCHISAAILKRKGRALISFFDIALQPDKTTVVFTIDKETREYIDE